MLPHSSRQQGRTRSASVSRRYSLYCYLVLLTTLYCYLQLQFTTAIYNCCQHTSARAAAGWPTSERELLTPAQLRHSFSPHFTCFNGTKLPAHVG